MCGKSLTDNGLPEVVFGHHYAEFNGTIYGILDLVHFHIGYICICMQHLALTSSSSTYIY